MGGFARPKIPDDFSPGTATLMIGDGDEDEAGDGDFHAI